ncbi:MAG: UDP-galactopyranose mutase, partial [Lachnospiraceae bacterium]|nr:UDP-galactopyranose mutase [Lachnospiraceae bacterium]
MRYDMIIVGCGFTGATIAYKAAKDGKRVLILEKRDHIAGNMYDYMDDTGIMVQKYGPHSFHTDKEEVYDFISQIGNWYEYILRARVMIDEKYTPSPFNFKTIDQFYSEEEAAKLKEALTKYYNNAKKVTVVELLESKDERIRQYAQFLFEKDYRPYTAKQWGIDPGDLDISVLKRVPVRLDYTDGYFDDKYQLMPEGGFTKLFEGMLDSPLIDVELNCDALSRIRIENNEIWFDGEKLDIPLIYTGPLDELFDNVYGRLPYRSLRFDLQVHNVDSFQETSGVAYPMAEGYTRITEYKKLPIQDVKGKT